MRKLLLVIVIVFCCIPAASAEDDPKIEAAIRASIEVARGIRPEIEHTLGVKLSDQQFETYLNGPVLPLSVKMTAHFLMGQEELARKEAFELGTAMREMAKTLGLEPKKYFEAEVKGMENATILLPHTKPVMDALIHEMRKGFNSVT